MKTQVTFESTTRVSFIVLIALLCLPSFSLQAQTTRYVKATATGNGSGSDWNNASSDLQLMINQSVSGDRVNIAEGVYRPIRPANNVNIVSVGNRDNAFVVKHGVNIYGGYTNAGDQIANSSLVVLSGDIGVPGNNADNCYHVIVAARSAGSGGSDVTMEWLTITGGNANGGVSINVNSIVVPQNYGGGSFASNTNLEVRYCIYTGNYSSDRGGGMYNSGNGAMLWSCQFTNNSTGIHGGAMFNEFGGSDSYFSSFENNSAVYGGAVYNHTSASYFVQQCSYIGNSASQLGGAVFNNNGSYSSAQNVTFTSNTAGTSGGAIYNNNSATANISRSTFTSNTSSLAGGAVYSSLSATPSLNDCNFTSNYSGFGGALYNMALSYVRRCKFQGNTANSHGGGVYQTGGVGVYENCLITGNTTVSPGGGGAGMFIDNSFSALWNCTISGNRDSDNGNHAGGVYILNASPSFRNCIIWNNNTGVRLENSTLTASYTICQDALPGNLNNTQDPLFKDGPSWGFAPFTGGDYRVRYCSPAINSGDNGVWYPENSTDIAGTPRLMVTVDRGAYERSHIQLSGNTIYVRQGYTGGAGTGESWANAVDNLTDALIAANWNQIYYSAANPLRIFVARGTYKPASRADNLCSVDPNDRNNAFVMVKNVQLYGGFDPDNGIDDLSDTRIFGDNGTILSGDLGSAATTDNSYHVVISAGDAGASMLDGFTITKGYADLMANQFSINSRLIVGYYGAGMYNTLSSPSINNCIFVDNKTDTTFFMTFYGGGMYNALSSPSINKCSFYSNVANEGGGMYNFNKSSPQISNSIFAGNVVTWNGGGMVNHDTCAPVITNCIFAGNLTTAYNSRGGGMANQVACSPQIVNCTFSGNRIPDPYFDHGGAVENSVNCSPVFRNCIIWGNSSGVKTLAGGGAPSAPNGIIQGGTPGGFDYEPRFLNAPHYNTAPFTSFDYRVEPCSPAINFGYNNLVSPSTTTDINGQPRIQFDYVDLGAYESIASIATSAGLPPGDTVVNQIQLANGSTTYVTNCNTIIASVTGDGTANAISGNTFVRTWLQPVQPAQFVRRHYQIVPLISPNTSTGTITLYFTQEDFDAFNAINATKLPQHPSDAAGKASLLIEKRGGASSNNSGLPDTYPGPVVTINPNDAGIIWNAAASRWEVSFPVTGFSGFFVKTSSFTLPLRLISFTARENNCTSILEWITAEEVNVSHFEVEQSTSGTSFNTITTTPARNTSTQNTYAVAIPVTNEKTFYRLKMVDIDGRTTYSQTLLVTAACTIRILLYPNPAKEKIVIRNAAIGSIYALYDNTGKSIRTGRITNPVHELHIESLAPGIYYISLMHKGGRTEKLRFVKE